MLKATTSGVALLINFIAIVWTAAMFFNGKEMGDTAFVSKGDSYVAAVLLGLSFFANVVLGGSMLRHARTDLPATPEREWDVPCSNCGAAVSKSMRFCTLRGQKNPAAPS